MSQDTIHTVASTASTLTYAEAENLSQSLDDRSYNFDDESFLGSQIPECPESPAFHSRGAGLIPVSIPNCELWSCFMEPRKVHTYLLLHHTNACFI